MVSFLNRLVTVLSSEDKNWRAHSVLLLDGAAYHRSVAVRVLLRRLNVDYIISGPYAYDAAPVELYFSYFKR